MTTAENTTTAMDMFEEIIVSVVLGWLLGLLGPIIVDAIRRRREMKEVKAAILNELRELQYRLANTVYLTSIQVSQYNRSFLEWYKAINERYRGPHSSEHVLRSIEGGLELSDEQLAIACERLKGGENIGLGLKTHHAPLLESKVAQLGSFSMDWQTHLLDITSRLGILNEVIEEYRFYFQETFSPSLDEPNRTLIKGNIHGSFKAVSAQGRMICDAIDRVLELDG